MCFERSSGKVSNSLVDSHSIIPAYASAAHVVYNLRTAMAVPMANDPPFATLNHFAADLGILTESDLLRIGISVPSQVAGSPLVPYFAFPMVIGFNRLVHPSFDHGLARLAHAPCRTGNRSVSPIGSGLPG
jgi:hypothetical protein